MFAGADKLYTLYNPEGSGFKGAHRGINEKEMGYLVSWSKAMNGDQDEKVFIELNQADADDGAFERPGFNSRSTWMCWNVPKIAGEWDMSQAPCGPFCCYDPCFAQNKLPYQHKLDEKTGRWGHIIKKAVVNNESEMMAPEEEDEDDEIEKQQKTV